MLISADCHIQEPTDLFTSRLPQEDHYRAPTFHRLPNRMKLFVTNGILSSKTPDYVRPVNEAGTEFELIGPDDIEGYLHDLDSDRVWGAVLHPNIGNFIFDIDDPAFALTCARIYNDHVREVYDSERLFPMALVPLHDIHDAVEEVERVAALGFRGVEVPMSAPPEAPYFSHRYDPVWAAAQRVGLPIFHIGSGLKRGSSMTGTFSAVNFAAATNTGALWPPGHPDHLEAIMAVKTTMGGFGGFGDVAAVTIPQLVGGGVLERFPEFHFVFVEVGARWLLNLMDTMDDAWHVSPGVNQVNRIFFKADGSTYEQFQPDEIGLEWCYPLLPSEYVRRQVHVTFMDDWMALRNRGLTGIEPLIWGNDYPHNEGTWPKSSTAIRQQLEKIDLPADERDAIFGGTIAKLLHIEVPSE